MVIAPRYTIHSAYCAPLITPYNKDNDENMIIMRGDQRVADICFTEFNRLFNHYYFRSVVEATAAADPNTNEANLFL